jgi:signal-transduction protein with cAMP-binding, CBS, and nucleotidyltransferase domain
MKETVKIPEVIMGELYQSLNSFSKISTESWQKLLQITTYRKVKKGTKIIEAGKKAKYAHYLAKGSLIAYYTDSKGKEYIKSIFIEKSFPSAQTSLLQNQNSYFTIEAIEDSIVLDVNFWKFKQLLETCNDLKDFYIAYLEKIWVVEKEGRELSLVLDSSMERYIEFLRKYSKIQSRLKQKHIASHLGITTTQLWRLQKKLNY